MATIRDQRKYSEWQKRMAQFRRSGLSIGKFCKREGVAVHSFHYWAKRCKAAAVGAIGSGREDAKSSSSPESDTAKQVVRVDLDGNVSVLVPADRLDVIRCVLECAKPGGEQKSAFKQVVVR